MNYLLDTGIVLTYLRDNEASKRLENNLQLLNGANNLIVSVVSIGELKSISKQRNWGSSKIQRLLQVVDDFIIADINNAAILERYATIDAYSQGKLEVQASFTSRNMGKNDLWIAATASVFDLELITLDKDFNHLSGNYLKLNRVDLENLPR